MTKSVASLLAGNGRLISFHATGLSQWLMTDLMSAEFIWHFLSLEGRTYGEPNLSARCGVQLLNTEIFWQCRSTALQRNHSPIAIRHSPFTIR